MASPAGDRQLTRWTRCLSSFFKSLGGRYKRIRRRVKTKPDPVVYEHKKEILAQLEALAEQGLLRLFYGDESHVCSEGYTPYGWQFPGEDVFMAAQKGFRLNCWGLISRDNECHWATSRSSINSAFVYQQLDAFSWSIHGPTVVVLDNASVHRAKLIQDRRGVWEQRGLYLFFLPPYCPHLNIAETLWRHLKGGWLVADDYLEDDRLAYALNRCLANVGKTLKIKFSPFNAN